VVSVLVCSVIGVDLLAVTLEAATDKSGSRLPAAALTHVSI